MKRKASTFYIIGNSENFLLYKPYGGINKGNAPFTTLGGV
jgi:hypothetical protein